MQVYYSIIISYNHSIFLGVEPNETLDQQMNSNIDSLMAEWEKHMTDFVLSDIINFEIAPHEREVKI